MTAAGEIRKKWKRRAPDAHKGDFGKIFILAGSEGLSGAAHLAGMGAMRAGAGLVTVGVPRRIYEIAARRESEVMVRPFPCTSQGALSYGGLKAILKFLKTQDVLAMGPGLSQVPATQKLIRALIQRSACPLVLDADALNALAGHTGLLKKACADRAVLTPHPGEFVRLFGKPVPRKEKDRIQRARQAALESRAVVVLKGHHTVIASPEGRTFVNTTGNPGMASGGTGDVLTGVIAALMGQGLELLDAARFGVYFHGLAGDIAARKKGEVSLIATDLLDALPGAFRRVLAV